MTVCSGSGFPEKKVLAVGNGINWIWLIPLLLLPRLPSALVESNTIT